MATTTRRHLLERRDQDMRRRELDREDLISKLNRDAVFKSNLSSDDRVDAKRRVRNQRIREEEKKTYSELLEAAQRRVHREVQHQKAQEEEKAANDAEMDRLREDKMRQAIRENSSELRELEKKLNNAYMNKERSLQVQERHYHVQQAKAKEAELIAEMNRELERQKQKDLVREREAFERSVEYSRALNDQLLEQEARQQAEFEQFLIEKAQVDAIVQKILDEDEREAKQRLEKQNETKQFIEKFIIDREKWRQEEKKRQEAETQRIEEYARMQQEREVGQLKAKAHRDEERNVIYDRLAAEMERQERDKAEFEQLRIDLYQEEQEEASRKRDQEVLQNRIRKRLELIEAYRSQMLEKRFRMLQEQDEEEEFRLKMMQKYAEDEKIEQMNAQRRRMKQLEHKRAVDALIVERRRLVAKEHEILIEEAKRETELDNYRQQVIEQERQRLLREHAAGLLGYLPKGVLRDQKDLELFDDEFRRKFEQLGLHGPEPTS